MNNKIVHKKNNTENTENTENFENTESTEIATKNETPREENNENTENTKDAGNVTNTEYKQTPLQYNSQNSQNSSTKSEEYNVAKSKLLKIWASHCSVFRWLHDRSAKDMKQRYMRITIPILVFNTLSGMAIYNTKYFTNIGLSNNTFQFLIGTLNVLCAILNGVRDITRYSELEQLHILSSLRWTKLKNELYVELIVPQEDAHHHTNSTKDENFQKIKILYNELMQSSPTIPNFVISKFVKKFKHKSIFVELPDIVREATDRNTFEKLNLASANTTRKNNIFFEKFIKKTGKTTELSEATPLKKSISNV
jgi:hypothetical protein